MFKAPAPSVCFVICDLYSGRGRPSASLSGQSCIFVWGSRQIASYGGHKEHVLLLCQRLCGRAVVNNVQCRPEIPGSRPAGIMKTLAGIYNVAFRVRPVPGALVISRCAAPWGTGPRCVERPRGRGLQADLGWKLFFRNLSVRRLPHGQNISILLRRTCHFLCSAVHPWLNIGRCSKSLLPRRVLWSAWSHPLRCFLRAGHWHEAGRRQSSWGRATGWIYSSGTLPEIRRPGRGLSRPLPHRAVVCCLLRRTLPRPTSGRHVPLTE